MPTRRDMRAVAIALLAGALLLALGSTLGSGVAMPAAALMGGVALVALGLGRHPGRAPDDVRPTAQPEASPADTAKPAALAPTAEAEPPAPTAPPVPEPEPPEIDIAPSLSRIDPWDEEREPPSTLDFAALRDRLVGSSDPLAELRLLVGDIRTHEAGEGEPPSPYERYAARLLSEAGLLDAEPRLPGLRIVTPPASGMLYLRLSDREPSLAVRDRTLALEAALNALRFSDTYFDDPDAHEVEEHYQLLQRLTRSITAQSPNLADNVPVIEDEAPDTEWAVRLGISTAIESFQLPHRLVASWRVNVADGNVALQLELTPESAFPRTRWVEGLGLVPTTREMRRQEASDYALRLALLVAAAAFRTSAKVTHVWVAELLSAPNRRSCLLSVDFDRWRFARLDLSDLGDLDVVYRSFAPALRHEGGILRPVEQTFSLGERRFCPPWRFEPVSLSNRRIERPLQEALGCERVSGLSIDEAGKREVMAASIMAGLGDSTEKNVRMIMELAGDDPDPTVRSAAERTVGKLIEGSLAEDAQAVAEEFVAGDALSRAVERATSLLRAQDAAGAARVLEQVTRPLDQAGTYRDTPHVEHRFFPNYVERALYNRLFALEGRLPLLVPRAYYQAQFLLSVARGAQGDLEGALEAARRLVELSPLDARAHVHLTRCLEVAGRPDEAVGVLNHLLEVAHDPEGVAIAYYRMAFFQWGLGNHLAAQACYARALRFMPAYMPVVAMEMATLALQEPGAFREGLEDDEVERVLEDQGIPLAPTEQMSEAFLDCARASLDAEIFPVARSFAGVLGAFSHDDVMYGLIRSLEDGPEGWGDISDAR